MPRPSNTFTEGAFGPLTPIIPAPIDSPRDDTGRPEPRRWQYPVGWNLPIGVPGTEGLKLVPFSNLRQYAELYSVVRACIELRKQEILALEWDIVPTEGAEKKMRADSGMHMDFMQRKEEAVAFFSRPDPNYNSFASWMSAMLEDVFVIDALSLYLHPSRKPGMGLFGTDLAAIDVLDGTTIRPLLDLRGGKPKPPAPAYQQYMFGIPRTDLMDVIMQSDMKDLGEPAAMYRADQILYLPYSRRTWTPYGFPGIERAIIPVITGIKKQQYAMDWFTEGTIPGSWVVPGPDVATPAQQRELQETLNAIAGDVGFKHKIIVLPPGSKSEPQKPVVLADQFDEILMNQVMMAYEITPTELGVMPKVGMTQSPSASSQMQTSDSGINERKALKPMLMWLKRELFDYVIQRYCGQTDMQWSWKALDTNTDEQIQAATYKTLVSTGLMSVDEARVEMGKNPWGLPQTSDPVLITGTGVIPFGQISPQEAGAELGLPPIASQDEVAAQVAQEQAAAQVAATGNAAATAQNQNATEQHQDQASAIHDDHADPNAPPAPPGHAAHPVPGAPTPPGAPVPPKPVAPPTQPGASGPVHPQTGEPLKTDPETGKPLHPVTGKPMHSDNPMLKPKPGVAPPQGAAPTGAPLHPVTELPPGAPNAAASGKPPIHPATGQPIPPHPDAGAPPGLPVEHQVGAPPAHAVDPKTGQPIPAAHTATPEHAAVAGHNAPVATPNQPTHDPATGQKLPPPTATPKPGQGVPPPHPAQAPIDPKTGQPVPQGAVPQPPKPAQMPGSSGAGQFEQDKDGKPLHPTTGKPMHSDNPLLQSGAETGGNAVSGAPKPQNGAGTAAQVPPPGAPGTSPAQQPPQGQQSGAQPLQPPQHLTCPMCGGNGRNGGKPCTECKGTGFIGGQMPQPGAPTPPQPGPQQANPQDAQIGPDGKPLPPSREPGAPPPQFQGGKRPALPGGRASQETNTQTKPHNPVSGAPGGGLSPSHGAAQGMRTPKPIRKRNIASQAMLDELEALRKHLKQKGTAGRKWEAEYLPQTMVDDIYKELDSQRGFFE